MGLLLHVEGTAGDSGCPAGHQHPATREEDANMHEFLLHVEGTADVAQVTVDAREGISTGISAEDRARTLRLLADPAASLADFRRPGHINPLRCVHCCSHC